MSRVPLGLSQPPWNDEDILPFSSQQRRWQSRERSCSIEARLVTREVAGKGLTPGQGTPAELEGCKERRNRRRMDASGGMYVKGGVKRHTLLSTALSEGADRELGDVTGQKEGGEARNICLLTPQESRWQPGLGMTQTQRLSWSRPCTEGAGL